MKKILIFASLIICVNLCFSNCGNSAGDKHGESDTIDTIIKDTVSYVPTDIDNNYTHEDSLKRQAIAQMNYAIMAITRIIKYQSLPVLIEEYDRINNELRMEEVVNFSNQLISFRKTLLDEINKITISKVEQEVNESANMLERRNLWWSSLSNSLNNTIIPTGGNAKKEKLVFYGFLTLARIGSDIMVSDKNLMINELKAKWNFKKQDMSTFTRLRSELMDLENDLFRQLGLKEDDRLVEKEMNEFLTIVDETRAQVRKERLSAEKETYKHFADYYYHMGMTLLELKQYDECKPYFDEFRKMRSIAPVFRKDNKLGFVALATLIYDDNLTDEGIREQISIVKNNISDNYAAKMYCAHIYINKLKDYRSAYNEINDMVNSSKSNNIDEIAMFSSYVLPEIEKSGKIGIDEIVQKILNKNGVSINSRLALEGLRNGADAKKLVKNSFDMSDAIERPIYNPMGDYNWKDKFKFSINKNSSVDLDKIKMYLVSTKDGKKSVTEYELKYYNAFSLDQIKKKLPFLKSNTDVLSEFFSQKQKDVYVVKPIDDEEIKRGDLEVLERFGLEQDRLDDLYDFVLKNKQETDKDVIIQAAKTKSSSNNKKIATDKMPDNCLIIKLKGLKSTTITYTINQKANDHIVISSVETE